MALLAIPNFSNGSDQHVIEAIAQALIQNSGARLLDIHSDADHNRSVYTLTGAPEQLTQALLDGAKQAITYIDITRHRGEHPHVGALDVAPIVYTEAEDKGTAIATALITADRLGDELNLPVFLYGELADGRTRAELRKGGPSGLTKRIESGQHSDFGPRYGLHPTAGATLVTARPPLVAFNVELQKPATLDTAKQIATKIREGGPEGLPGVKAIGVELSGGIAQVSTNIENADTGSATNVVNAIKRHAPITKAELVGLAPARVFADMDPSLEIRNLAVLEEVLG
ncbi:MAG: hypothetical protein J2O48_00925 [Solirubrobacterales bacterium]|nr:hypothetical protein [Solirubrobacterales bacterium]